MVATLYWIDVQAEAEVAILPITGLSVDPSHGFGGVRPSIRVRK